MWPENVKIVSFGLFKLDLSSRELLTKGNRISLGKNAFKLLVLLLKAEKRVVKNEEIVDELWGEHPGGPDLLRGAIKELRDKMEDFEKRIIETIRDLGYRISLLVSFEGLAGVSGVTSTTPNETRLAVLPFTGLNEKIGLLDEMTVDMIRRFRRLAQGRFGVKDAQTVRDYSPSGKTDEEIGRDLGVEYYFKTEVSRGEEGLLHLDELLMHATDSVKVWSGSDDIRDDQMVPLRSELASALKSRVPMLPLSEALLEELAAKQGVNLDARHSYTEGRLCLERRTQQGMVDACKHFEEAIRAIEHDPNYARALARLADAYLLRGLAGFPGDDPRKMAERAHEFADRALEINSELAEALAAKATIYFRFDWEWLKADAAFKEAIAADPNYPTSHHWYAIYLNCMRRHEDAKREAERARSLSDRSAIIFADSAWPYYNKGEYDQAIRQCDSALEISPKFWLAHSIKGLVLHEAGKHDKAIEEYTAALESSPNDPRLLARMASAYASCNRPDDARQVLSRLEDLLKEGRKSHYFIAIAYAGLGDVDKATDSLDQAFKEKSPSFVFADLDPGLKSLHKNAKFEEIVSRLGKPPSGQRL
jgi:tetratricopeptide (TPR) repeat protein/DNA-binding winged helix-turn-helix (wHTH) protein